MVCGSWTKCHSMKSLPQNQSMPVNEGNGGRVSRPRRAVLVAPAPVPSAHCHPVGYRPSIGVMTCLCCEKKVSILRALFGSRYCSTEHSQIESEFSGLDVFNRLAAATVRSYEGMLIERTPIESPPARPVLFQPTSSASIRCVKAYGSERCRCQHCSPEK